MDFDSAADAPPIPVRARNHHHHHARQRSCFADSSLNPNRASLGSLTSLPPASPEVISNLITSLSAISAPANNHFEAHSYSVPTSPGSFGLEYGAFSQPNFDELRQEPLSPFELAASSPVIRTSKPPSGYSTVTAGKSKAPRGSQSPSREGSGGFRSFIRNSTSRPSSKGSQTSKNDDAQSIGNLSIERASSKTPELRQERSHDSWGKKNNGRSHKGLMYMSSNERLREKEMERHRASGTSSSQNGGSGSHANNRPDLYLAELAIHEEPTASTDYLPERKEMSYTIPPRESSLKKSSSTAAKRSSARNSRSKRESDVSDAIPEDDEPIRAHDSTRRKQRNSSSDKYAEQKSPMMSSSEQQTTSTREKRISTDRISYKVRTNKSWIDAGEDDDDMIEEGAPSPAVAQTRRRDEQGYNHNKRSGQMSPSSSGEMNLKVKRSSSRLKRLSAPLSPPPENRKREPSAERNHHSMPSGYERPRSADSVDDAVESYLCSPRLSQKIRHPQTGRTISFSEVGDSEGSAVFCCVGMGLTRYITAFYDELALTLKLRLITPDRPGVGDSEAYSDGTATPLSWPDDVYAICQALKITKFSILAHSAGAIYALATALRMPQHIRGRIHLLAPWIPPSQMNVFGTSQTLPPTNAIPTSQRILRALPTPILKAANSSFMTATSSSITSSLPKNTKRAKRNKKDQGRESIANSNRTTHTSLDKESIALDGRSTHGTLSMNGISDPHKSADSMDHGSMPMRNSDSILIAAAADAVADKERQVNYDLRLTHAIWELATTGANPAVDLLVCLERRHTIGFRYVDITRPVVIHHGSRDTRVPVDNVKWLGKTMRRCEVRVLEGEGHGLMASAGVMGSVLMEISKEWEDWMKVTGSDAKKEKERGRRGTIGRRGDS